MAEPFKWALTDPKKVRAAIDEYFNSLPILEYLEVYDPEQEQKIWKECQTGFNMPGVAGLAYALGINRMTLLTYVKLTDDEQQAHEGLAAIVRDLLRAKSQIEVYQERGLFDKTAHRGSMFSLAMNYGWRDSGGGEAGTGDGFVQNILPPAAADAAKAIPKWEPDE